MQESPIENKMPMGSSSVVGNDVSTQQPALIPANWTDFPDKFRERLGSTAGRQRCMFADSQLLIVAHQVPGPDESQRRGILFWLDSSGQWKASNGDSGKSALHMHLDRFSERIDQYDADEQDADHPNEYLHLLDGIVPITRSVKNLFATLEEARDLCPKERSLIDARDRAYDLSRQAELLHADVKNSMDVAMIRKAAEQSSATQRMAESAHRLNTLAALFLPIATLASILGTTLTENWSWSHEPTYFAILVLVGIGLGIAVAIFINRPIKN